MALPEEREQRFVALERIVRCRYEEAQRNLREDESSLPLLRLYMSNVLPAAKRYGVKELEDWKRPSPSEDDWAYYQSFMADVDYCTMDLRLKYAENLKRQTVLLDAVAKQKFRHLLAQMREIVDISELPVERRERLHARISRLEDEVNRDRTRLEAVTALWIEACAGFDQGCTKLEGAVRMLERIGAAVGIAKIGEDAQARLPKADEPKKIEPPKAKGGLVQCRKPSGLNRPLDDEIPF